MTTTRRFRDESIPTNVCCPNGCTVRINAAVFEGYNALCGCYDGAEDSGPQLIGYGKTPAEALDAFLEREEELQEVWWWLTSLDLLVRAESLATRDWRVIDGVYGPVSQPSAAAG